MARYSCRLITPTRLRSARSTRLMAASPGVRRRPSPFFFFQAEDGIRDVAVTGVQDVCSSDLVSRPGIPWEWDARTNGLPRVALAPRALFLDPTNTFRALFSEKFDPRERVYLPPEAVAATGASRSGSGIILEQRVTAHRIEATVETDGPMWLTVAQANGPGWRARVDRRSAELWTA